MPKAQLEIERHFREFPKRILECSKMMKRIGEDKMLTRLHKQLLQDEEK